MCCQDNDTLALPAQVIETLARYRRLLDDRGWDWGDEQPADFFRWARFTKLGPVFAEYARIGDWAKAVRSVIGGHIPIGVVVIRVDEGGGLRADVGPPRTTIAGRTVAVDVVIDSDANADLSVSVAGRSS